MFWHNKTKTSLKTILPMLQSTVKENFSIDWFKKILIYRYPVDGSTMLENVEILPYNLSSNQQIFDCMFKKQYDANALKHIDSEIDKCFVNLPEKVTLLLSGGIDSTFLLAKLMKNHDVTCLNINYGSYDESEQAQKVADAFGAKLRVLSLTDTAVERNIVEILRKLELPFDRGSTIPLYFLLQEAGKSAVVAGDSADCLFAPSMGSQFKALNGEVKAWDSLSHLEIEKFNNPFKMYSDEFKNTVYLDWASEIPYYYRYRYDQFNSLCRRIMLPFQNYYVASTTLQYDRPKDTNKWLLRKLSESYVPKHLVETPKKAFKIDPKQYQFLIDKYYDKQLVSQMLGNDHNWLACVNVDSWLKYLSTLFCIWYYEVLNHDR